MSNLTYKLANSAFLTDTGNGDITGAMGSQAQVQYFPRVLNEAGIPVMVANSGTIATDGTVTLGTALPVAYRGCFMYFPAAAVVGDATGGIYYVDMSTSTTVGVVYAGKNGVANGVTAAFSPQIPSVLTAVVGSNAGYTGSTTETNLINVAIPAGAIGNNGMVRVTVCWTTNNSVGAKTGKTYLGVTQVAQSAAYTTSVGGTQMIGVRNRGVLNVQTARIIGGTSTGAPTYAAIDSSAATYVGLSSTVAVATDFCIIEGYSVELLPKD